MSTTPRIEFRIEKKDHLAGVVIDSYVIEDNSSNSKIVRRHVERWIHTTMANTLSDAMYGYDSKIEFNIYENGLGGAIIADDSIRYTISVTHIEVFNDVFRKYRKYGITMSVKDNMFYITNDIGQVVYIRKIFYDKPIEEEYANLYTVIDNIYKGEINE